jgi:hypothetical protein
MTFTNINNTKINRSRLIKLLYGYLTCCDDRNTESTSQTMMFHKVQRTSRVDRFLAAVIYPRYGGLCTQLAILLEILLPLRTVALDNL